MFGSDSQIDILVTLKNQASAELGRLRSSLKDIEKASGDVGDAFGKTGRLFNTEINLMKTAAKAATYGVTALGTAIATAGAFALKSAADYEQNRIAFETMLGSADKAKKMLQDITKFAKETPFELPEVVEGSKRLLAYNVEQQKLIPTFKLLGEIASGVGKEKLPQLILAFGQVKAATRLTGMELRQFTEAGVPMLSQLAKQLKTTEGAIQDMVSDGQIGFPLVEKALQDLTGEGGRFHDLMIRQSTTLSGVWSNLKDSIGIIAREIIGMNTEGDVREGSIFDRLRTAAANFYTMLSDNQNAIAAYFSEKVDYAVRKVQEWWDSMGGAKGIVQKLEELWATLTTKVVPAVMSFIGIILDATKWIKDNWDWLWKVIAAYEALKVLIAGAAMVSAFTNFGKMVAASTTSVKLLGAAIKLLPVAIPITIALIGFQKIMDQISAVGEAINSLEKSRESLSDRVQSLKKKMNDASTDEEREKYKKQIEATGKALQSLSNTESSIADSLTIGSFFFGKKNGGYARGRANGGSISTMDETTLVGENGPEILRLPVGSRVIPNHQSRMGGNVTHMWDFRGAIIPGKEELIRLVEDTVNRKTELAELGSTI